MAKIELPSDRALVDAIHQEVGVTAQDLIRLRLLADNGFATFIHGSGITGKIGHNSDVDYAAIGDFTPRNLEMINEVFGINVPPELLGMIDYISTKYRAENQTKMSLHIENKGFRKNYTSRPFAVEYRPAKDQKPGGVSAYIIPAIDQYGQMFLVDMQCPKVAYKEGFISYTPQMGYVDIKDNEVYVPGIAGPTFRARSINYFNQAKGEFQESQLNQRVLIGGVELDKMVSDTALFQDGVAHMEEMVYEPLQKSMALLEQAIQQDPVAFYVAGYGATALLRGKSLSATFVRSLEHKLRTLVDQSR